METVRKYDFIKDYILTGLALFCIGVWIIITKTDLPESVWHSFTAVYFVLIFSQKIVFYRLSELWSAVCPIERETVIETIWIRLLSYAAIIIPSMLFLARGYIPPTVQTVLAMTFILLPFAWVWTGLNTASRRIAEHYKSAGYGVWTPNR